jgi:imidazolonepropionase-like amidohydrolase
VVDADGRWVVPGLIDTHTHVATNYQELTGQLPNRAELDAMTEAQLTLYLLNGVTTIVNLGDFGEPLIRFRNEVLQGDMVGPNIVAAMYARGPVNSGDGGPRDQSVRDSADANAFFGRAVEAGYDMIKIYNWTPASAARELLRLSAATGVPVSGHFPQTLHPRNTLDRGLANVAHAAAYHWTWFSGGDSPSTLADAAEATLAAGATISSTLGIMETVAQVWGNNTSGIAAYWARPENEFMHWTERDLHERGIAGPRWNPAGASPGGYDDDLEAIRRHAQAMVQAGVPIMAGTDSPTVLGVAGYSMHRELEALTRIGFSPLQALAAATAAPGAFLEQRVPGLDRVGRLAPGSIADLLIVDADPRSDVANLSSPWRVMARGTLHDPADLLNHVRTLQSQ